jgi:phosphoribosylanthranilate isomerase
LIPEGDMPAIRVKICGVTTPDDLRACADAGADAVGINFYPASPRFVDPRKAQPLLRAAPPLLATVGVFVAQPFRQVCAIAYQLGLRGIQWHGDNRERADCFPFALTMAFRVRNCDSLEEIKAYLDQCEPDQKPAAILVDAYVEGQEGGTGRQAPWGLLAGFQPGVPLILAGGLTPDNVGEAIRTVRPWAVDVASGVESSPGRKDPAKVRDFIANAREAAGRIA